MHGPRPQSFSRADILRAYALADGWDDMEGDATAAVRHLPSAMWAWFDDIRDTYDAWNRSVLRGDNDGYGDAEKEHAFHRAQTELLDALWIRSGA